MAKSIAALALAALLAAQAAAVAEDAPPARIRGVIEGVDGPVLSIKTRGGEQEKLRLAKGGRIVAIVRATLADIKPGSFVGSAAEPGPGDTLQAVEVHIFPEAMRGLGEGSRRFDLSPTSSMTNGSVAAQVAGVDGTQLTVDYHGGSKVIAVTPKTAIVRLEDGSASDLKPTAGFIAFGLTKAADGVIEARAINVGRDVTPPM